MDLHIDIKGTSKITLTLMMLISAVIGGIISYTFTIAYYAKIPEETTLTITQIRINPENVSSFNITVLNPSYSPSDANITRIALSLKTGTELYEVVETNPSISKGLKIRIGESADITCLTVRKGNTDISFGELINTFPGETILVHVFAEGFQASNKEVTLPNVKIKVTPNFEEQIRESIEYFNLTIENQQQKLSLNLTITEINLQIHNTAFSLNTTPSLPFILRPNTAKRFQCNFNWEGLRDLNITLNVKTKEGYEASYVTSKLPGAELCIGDISFDYDDTGRFNITVTSDKASTATAYITKVNLTLPDGTVKTINTTWPLNVSPLPVFPGRSVTLTCIWNWSTCRSEVITVIVCTKQGYTLYKSVRTPSPIFISVLGETTIFNLRDKERFNITILNHASSLEAVNITKIVVKKTGDILPIVNGNINPSFSKTFTCHFNWALFLKNYGRDLALTIYANAIQSSNVYTFDFSFTLPVAELNITTITHTPIGNAGYLNLTVKNLDYSIWNLTLSKIVVFVQDLNETLEYLFPENHLVLTAGGEFVLLCPFNWQKYVGKTIMVTVITKELVEVSTSYTIGLEPP
ncbi:MAG: hypothetical protein QXL38_03405 [Candidatus Bathyarchaeia archaeon]